MISLQNLQNYAKPALVIIQLKSANQTNIAVNATTSHTIIMSAGISNEAVEITAEAEEVINTRVLGKAATVVTVVVTKAVAVTMVVTIAKVALVAVAAHAITTTTINTQITMLMREVIHRLTNNNIHLTVIMNKAHHSN